MAGLLDLLNSEAGQEIIGGVSRETGAPADKTAKVLGMGLPVLMSAMRNNAASAQGAEGLLSALSDKRHDGSILDDLAGLFGGGVDTSVMREGEGILGHILGSRQPEVQSALSQRSGLDSNTVAHMLKIAAPILLGFLGKQTRQNNVSSTSGLGDLLGSVMGGSAAHQNTDMLSALLDADGDGSILDDVAGMVMGGSKKGGLGGLLGNIFGNG